MLSAMNIGLGVGYSTFSISVVLNSTPIHEKAMPVIVTNLDEQNPWLNTGDKSTLRPYEGELESDHLPSKLEQLFPDENQKY